MSVISESAQQKAEEALVSALRDYFIAGLTQEDADALSQIEWDAYAAFIEENNVTDLEKARAELDEWIETHPDDPERDSGDEEEEA